MKSKTILLPLFLILVGLLGACVTHPDYVNDFSFPIEEGDIQRGEELFVDMRCIQCHTIRDYELPAYELEMPINVELGGVMLYAKTYADLVTSIIYPNYRISERYLKQFPRSERNNIKESPMHIRNDDMKVSELIDLVAFLNSRYSLVPGYREEFIW